MMDDGEQMYICIYVWLVGWKLVQWIPERLLIFF